MPSLHSTRLANQPIRCGRLNGSWRIAVRDGTWRTLDAALRCFDDLADVTELERVASWAAEVLSVPRVELVADRRGWIVHIDGQTSTSQCDTGHVPPAASIPAADGSGLR